MVPQLKLTDSKKRWRNRVRFCLLESDSARFLKGLCCKDVPACCVASSLLSLALLFKLSLRREHPFASTVVCSTLVVSVLLLLRFDSRYSNIVPGYLNSGVLADTAMGPLKLGLASLGVAFLVRCMCSLTTDPVSTVFLGYLGCVQLQAGSYGC